MADNWDKPARKGRHYDDADTSVSLPAFLSDPLGALRRRWIWMSLALLVGITVTGMLMARFEPTYVAETSIVVSSQAIPQEFVRATVREDSLAHINAIIGQVLSRKNLGQLIDKYRLYDDLRAGVPLAAVIDYMRSRIEVEPQRSFGTRDSSSQIYLITFEHDDPEIAATIANELAGFFTAANIEMRNRQAQLTTEFLRRELENAEHELRAHDRRITEFRQRNRGGLPTELQTNLAKLERLQAQRESLAIQIDGAEGRLMALESAPPDETAKGPSPESLLHKLQLKLEEQLVILTEEHPNVVALKRRIERLQADAAKADPVEDTSPRGARLAAERRQLAMLREQLASTVAAIGRLDEQVQGTPMREEELAALEQREVVLKENYLQFLRKVQAAELAQSMESAQHGARVSVLDRASPPPNPKVPRWTLLAIGVVGSLALSLAIGVLLELLDAVIVSPGQLEDITEHTMLGSVPRIAA